MIVLHGIWIPPMDVPGDDTGAGKLAIWGEGSPISVSQPKPGRRAKHQTSKPLTHPFASTTNELLLLLGELTGDGVYQGEALSGQADTVSLLLPSSGNEPIASPEMIPPSEDPIRMATVLAAWEVSCISLSAVQALSLLSLLPEESESGLPGIALAADLRFWSKVAKLALELLARQRFVPSLKSKSEGRGQKYYAHWLPILQDPIGAERVSALVRAMPPVCRAFLVDLPSHAAGGGADSTPARFFSRPLVESFLQAVVDQVDFLFDSPKNRLTDPI